MRRARLAGFAILMLAAAAAEAAPGARGPAYIIARDGTLVLGGLPEIVSRPEVRPHLTTGLTTTFLISVNASAEGAGRTRGAARVDIRWEPWDEVFHVAAFGADGRTRKESLPSLERLAAWWRGLELPAALGLSPGTAWEVKVEVDVLPFSSSEQRDAQRWFSSSLGPETTGGPPRASEGESRLNGVVDLLMATSIGRRSVVRYAWRAVPRPASPRRP